MHRRNFLKLIKHIKHWEINKRDKCMIPMEWRVIKASSLKIGHKIHRIWEDLVILVRQQEEEHTGSKILLKDFKTFLGREVAFLQGRLQKKEEMLLLSLKFNLWKLFMARRRKLAIRRLLSAQPVKGQNVGRGPRRLRALHVAAQASRLCSKVLWYFKLRVQFVVGEEVQ